MKFQVPQFIEIEDKIFGPLTFKQFIYLAGGGGMSFVLWVFLPTLFAIPAILAVAGFVLALAFYTYNGKPFVFLIQSWLTYTSGNKLYLWRKNIKQATTSAQSASQNNSDETLIVPKLSQGKLKDIAWNLDVENPEYTTNT
jgi:hypothetical protein